MCDAEFNDQDVSRLSFGRRGSCVYELFLAFPAAYLVQGVVIC